MAKATKKSCIVVGLLAGAVLVGGLGSGMAMAGAVPAESKGTKPSPSVEAVPGGMDSSNQAGWWKPLAEFGGAMYFAFNAPSAGGEFRHEVHIAKRTPSGKWRTGCLREDNGECVSYPDDVGHNQPTIAIDGDGYVHAFVSMHNDDWRYYRSDEPESVTTMVNRSDEMPDAGMAITYPVANSAPSGDVYLITRVDPADANYSGRFYRWNNDTGTWRRVAIFAKENGFTPYPDDVHVDDSGQVHISWEWARGGPSGSRYYGSYLVYQPDERRFVTISGREVEVPVTTTEPEVVYEPGEGVVQVAKFALVDTSSERLAGVAYRYQPESSEHFEMRWASWDGDQWLRETVDDRAATTAGVAATHHNGVARIYFTQEPACDQLDLIENGGLFVAEKRTSGSARKWRTHWIGGAAGVQRLAALGRDDGTDVLYLAAPREENPVTDPSLYYATLDRNGSAPSAIASTSEPEKDRKNWAYGAPVSVSSTSGDGTSIGECAVDGNFWSAASRWIPADDDPEPTLTVDFDAPIEVGEVHVFSGDTDPVPDFVVEARVAGEWAELAHVDANVLGHAIVTAPGRPAADRLRLRMPAGGNPIHEIEVYSTIEASPVGTSLSTDPEWLAFPGEAAELRATLANRTPEPVSGTAEVELPDGWTAAPADRPYRLAPYEQATVTFTVTSAQDAPSYGRFELAVRTGPDDPGTAVDIVIREGIVYVSDGDPAYTETGEWGDSLLRGHDDSATRFAEGNTGATATWTPELRKGGRYHVYTWHPANTNTTTKAQFTVMHAGGEAEVTVNQRDTGDGWHQLGTWEFSEGRAGSVTLEAATSGYHRAGAIRFEAAED